MKAQGTSRAMVQQTHESCSNSSHPIVIIGFQIYANKNYSCKVYPPFMPNTPFIFVTSVTSTQAGGRRHRRQKKMKKPPQPVLGGPEIQCEAHEAPRAITASAAA
jgi:hypothetical protein